MAKVWVGLDLRKISPPRARPEVMLAFIRVMGQMGGNVAADEQDGRLQALFEGEEEAMAASEAFHARVAEMGMRAETYA